MNQLNDHFKKGKTANKKIRVVGIVGIVGIGGAGKTTLARAYAKAQPNAVVWEINAETHTSLVDSFMSLASALAQTKELKDEFTFIKAIQNAEEKEKQLIVFVKGQLKNKQQWLLVYDNVEAFSQVKEFFPHDVTTWGEGDVIITTRDSNIINSTHVGESNVIQIDQLSPDEALRLFCKILYQKEPKDLVPEEEEKVREFLTKIPPFPLDVSVAAHYIKNASLTLDQYSERVAHNSQAFDKRQQVFVKEISDYTQTRYGLITLSIAKLIELNPEYKDLLFLISLLDSQDIPLNLLAFYKDPALVDQFLRDLKKYSLITSKTSSGDKKDDGSFSLHRSTQLLGQAFLLNSLSQDNKNILISRYVEIFDQFYIKNERNNYRVLLGLIPHLNIFMKSMELCTINKADKNKYKQNIIYIVGMLHTHSARNIFLGQEYLKESYQLQESTHLFSNEKLAVILKNLAETNVELDNIDEAIAYAQKSLELCNMASNLHVLAAKNLRIVGFAYSHKNEFEKARQAFRGALEITKKIEDKEARKETAANINVYIARLYSSIYINGERAKEGAFYAERALKSLNGDHLYYKQNKNPEKNISCNIARHKVNLGIIYSRIGEYKKAYDSYFKDANFIIDNALDNCSHNLSKVCIAAGEGEIYLRLGRLEAARNKLADSTVLFSKILGNSHSSALEPRTFLIETRIRLGELAEAYDECLSSFKIKQTSHTNYQNLIIATGHYHAAVIKQKQDDLKKSYEHFKDFFDRIKPICKAILTDQKYNTLEESKAFDAPAFQEATSKDSIKRCFQQSTLIFSTIYGEEHPFVRDYVMVNNNFG